MGVYNGLSDEMGGLMSQGGLPLRRTSPAAPFGLFAVGSGTGERRDGLGGGGGDSGLGEWGGEEEKNPVSFLGLSMLWSLRRAEA